jgi:hypothetical protein
MFSPRIQMFVAFLWVPVFLALIYFSFISPWPTARDALSHLEPGPRVVIALQRSFDHSPEKEYRIQTYLAFPDSFHTFNAYEVTLDRGQVQVRPIRFGFLVFICLYGTWIAVSLWCLVRYRRQRELSTSDG